ncbi:MAG: MarR family transcriptional regulator [Nitriliruptoraceae bacterium]
MTAPSPSDVSTAQRDAQPTMSADHLSAWRCFLEAHRRVIDQLSRQLRDEEGLALTWYDVLVQLSEAEGHELRMQELAAAILLSRSGLTRLIDKMESAGLVERDVCETDGRGTLARMTPSGMARLQQAAPAHIAGVIEQFARHLDDDEVVVVERALRRIANAS